MYSINENEALAALKSDDSELSATAEALLWSAWCRSGDPETERLFRAGVDAMLPSCGLPQQPAYESYWRIYEGAEKLDRPLAPHGGANCQGAG